ncbi:hypothetical protein AOQ84DRAFT_370214 [Glonium stellatum]|uniref:Uncharacterized protein n=1 Tax=Glonium stellatum TaxID=574774 RepID=A0A8E2EMR2_9PEZI|nr:hypothetical protein AOQ84DRAFT_370214 [Glonium stellatum]
MARRTWPRARIDYGTASFSSRLTRNGKLHYGTEGVFGNNTEPECGSIGRIMILHQQRNPMSILRTNYNIRQEGIPILNVRRRKLCLLPWKPRAGTQYMIVMSEPKEEISAENREMSSKFKEVAQQQNEEDMTQTIPTDAPSVSTPLYTVFATLAGLISPLSAKIYTPALNVLSSDLEVSSSSINLTLTIYMIF